MISYRTEDHPEANGRRPQQGDVQYVLKFTMEDGQLLEVKMGQKGFETVTQLLFDMLMEAPPYDDGSLSGK